MTEVRHRGVCAALVGVIGLASGVALVRSQLRLVPAVRGIGVLKELNSMSSKEMISHPPFSSLPGLPLRGLGVDPRFVRRTTPRGPGLAGGVPHVGGVLVEVVPGVTLSSRGFHSVVFGHSVLIPVLESQIILSSDLLQVTPLDFHSLKGLSGAPPPIVVRFLLRFWSLKSVN